MKNLLLLILFVSFVEAGIGVGVSSKGAIPVELTFFAATILDNSIQLEWTTATEKNNSGFEIQKSTDNFFWDKVSFVEGNGTTTEINTYIFVDNNVTTGTYFYRLKQVDYDGKFNYSKIIEVTIGQPTEYELAQNYPNPFNPSTIISYSIPEESFVSIKVYDLLGKEIATLVDERQTAGNYQKSFNANGLSNGVYFYRIQTNSVNNSANFIETKKMSIVK